MLFEHHCWHNQVRIRVKLSLFTKILKCHSKVPYCYGSKPKYIGAIVVVIVVVRFDH